MAKAKTSSQRRTSQRDEFRVDGDRVVKKVKEVIREGNARKIILKNEQGKILMEIPLTFAAVGAVAAPMVAAVGALAALVTKCTIVVERK